MWSGILVSAFPSRNGRHFSDAEMPDQSCRTTLVSGSIRPVPITQSRANPEHRENAQFARDFG